MSSYDPYDNPRDHHHHHHPRRYNDDRHGRGEARYVEQETYLKVNPSSRNALIPRAREDSDLSIEEVRRDFPPLGYTRDIRRARSAEPGHEDYYLHDPRRSYEKGSSGHGRRPGSVYYEEEERTRKHRLSKQEKIIAAVAGGIIAAGAKEVWDRREGSKEHGETQRNIAATAAIGAAGAFAGYQGADYYNKHKAKEERKSTYAVHRDREGRVLEYYSDDDEEDPKTRKRNKSFLESALSAAGLGGAIKVLTGGGGDSDDESHRSRSRRGSPDSHRSRNTPAARMQKAAKASLVAGAAEAFRVAKEPGGWKGEKMKRVMTAAAGAAAIDAAHDPTKDGTRHLVESVIGGLVGNRVINGPRKDIEEDRATGRSRSRSRARSSSRGGRAAGVAALATGLGAALGAKKLVGRSHSRSRSRSRSHARSYDSYSDRSGSPPRRRSRSRSIVNSARRSLAKIGLGEGPDDERDSYYDDRPARRRGDGRHSNDDDGSYDDRSRGGRDRNRSHSRGRSSSVSSSDLGDSDTDRKVTGKMRRKQLITTGLATVATIHAAHNVYQSMEARNARHRAVQQGKLSPQEAKKLKSKAILQDAASVGIAALGIKGALSELKEAREQAKSINEWKQERERRHQKRLERLQRANRDDGGQSRDYWRSSSLPTQSRRYDDGPRYADGNPYSAALPAPPISGYDD